MKKLLLLILLSVIFNLSSTAVFSYDWEQNGFKITAMTGDTSSTKYLILKDSNGRVIYVEDKDIDEVDAAEIAKMTNIFYNLQNIKVAELKFVTSDTGLSVFLKPASFVYNDLDINTYLISGMQFSYYTNTLNYNFRIKNNNMFLKVTGVYIDEKSLCDKISEAITDPQSFLKRRDTEFLLMKIDQLEQKFEKMQAENLAAIKKLEEANNVLGEESKNNSDNLNKLRSAVVSFQNDRFFGSADPISASKVEKIIELKKSNPKYTKTEIKDKMDKDKADVSEGEIEIVLNVFFNEYEK